MNDMILILNYSDEFSVDTARRLRAEQVYSRIISGMTTAAQIRDMAPRGIILSGEAQSAQGVLDAGILDLGIPVLALGHAAHMLLAALGGASADMALEPRKAYIEYGQSALFTGLTGGERYMQETLTLMLPPDVQMIASAAGVTVAFEQTEKKQYGVQFELERNDPEGSAILKNFARDICGCAAWWSPEAAMREAERELDRAAAQGGSAVCAVSGGVDSTVAAVLTHRAFGERMTAIFVETGLMREGEGASVQQTFDALGIPLLRMDRSGVVLDALAHRRSMEEKRQVVISSMHEELLRQLASMPDAHTVVLGTNYSDALGGVPDRWGEVPLTVVEPLATLFKDEVRAMAVALGLGAEMAERKPFPALGLGARMVGEVTAERLHALRKADSIFSEEIRAAGLERKLYKFFPILTDSDPISGAEMIILRAVTLSGAQLMPARLPYDLVERTVQRIREEAPSIVRVFYDETPTQLGRERFI